MTFSKSVWGTSENNLCNTILYCRFISIMKRIWSKSLCLHSYNVHNVSGMIHHFTQCNMHCNIVNFWKKNITLENVSSWDQACFLQCSLLFFLFKSFARMIPGHQKIGSVRVLYQHSWDWAAQERSSRQWIDCCAAW